MKHNPQEPVNGTGVEVEQHLDGDGPLAASHPPLHIVTSCETLGFYGPMDCYWREISLSEGESMPERLTCACSEHRRFGSRWSGLRASAPIDVFIHRCLFNEPETTSVYRMGQCPACRTIYWAREESA